MPIYEYVCRSCDKRFELIRPVSRSAESATCPGCEGSAERVLSRFCSFTTDDSGMTAPVGGSSCSGCDAISCSTCNN